MGSKQHKYLIMRESYVRCNGECRLAYATGGSKLVGIINVSTCDSDKKLVLVSDDSIVTRKQVCRTLENDMSYETVTAKNGQEALDILKGWADNGDPQLDRLAMVSSDIDMPEMGGYTFTTAVRADDRLKDIYIILHTSMSGVFNQEMVDKVGADKFIAKFNPDLLAAAVLEVAVKTAGQEGAKSNPKRR